MNEGNEATDSVGTGTTTFVSTEVGVGMVIFFGKSWTARLKHGIDLPDLDFLFVKCFFLQLDR